MIEVAVAKRLPGFDLDVAFADSSGATALFGRSGSGKSLTLGLIAGLARPDAGRVLVDGTPLVDVSRRLFVPTHRRRVGLVFQDSHLFPHLSVRKNLLFGRWFAPRAAAAASFDAVVETLGIAALLERRPGALSGGERQRVAIGRALLAAPRLLLLDEPFAALDRQRKLEILPLIERVRAEFSVPLIYVSHALEEVVRIAKTVVVLDAGRVVASGAPEAVLGATRVAEDRRFGRASILTARVGAYDDAFDLTALAHPAGTLWLAGRAGEAGSPIRVLIKATDVSLAPADPGPLTIRSALAGRIASIVVDGPLAAATVALEGGESLVALVTRRALHDLGLVEGAPVRALVKTVALDEGAVGHALDRG
ncbi:Molybdenum import ATP-binding protein ModC [Beijerinckiaceae bacterium RH CH11]|nr:Molybdenum import ATP-binding protein ModC [Beijerinckiaceae bacterium RH CH11]VVB49562.1 Molybdenum import ATP-binding protein ModC [Beijerinckiaceae bacterium RH AL8]